MTAHSQRRVVKAVDMLLQRSPVQRIYNPIIQKFHDFKVGFVTLTIPATKSVEAKFAHEKLLQPFLRAARRKWGVQDYIWKAELQQRGQLHYHITWNRFVDWVHIRNVWNSLLRKHRLSDDYAKRFGHFNPNSVDVHSVWKVRNLKAYLAKYIAKEEQNKSRLNGKVWDCSMKLKERPFTVICSYSHMDKIDDGVSMGVVNSLELEHCVLFKMKQPELVLSNDELGQYKQFLS